MNLLVVVANHGKKFQLHGKHMKKINGFSLIELMVVIAIIGILAGIAYPSYTDSVRKSRRAEAKEALLAAAGRQERYYLQQNKYVITSADIASVANTTTENGYYAISVASCSGASETCFKMTATAAGAQVSDTDCKTFTIDNVGNKGATNSSDVAVTNCW